MLSDYDIRRALKAGHLEISPFEDANLQPASYDLTLDRHFLVPNLDVTEIDMANVREGHMRPEDNDGSGLVIEPGEFLLGSTRETVRIGDLLLGRVEGKSSIGRLGLIVHITAGFIDPGFEGQITLEIVNHAPWDIIVYPGQRICQIAFSRLENPPTRAYGEAGNHYQNQRGPVESRFQAGTLPVL